MAVLKEQTLKDFIDEMGHAAAAAFFKVDISAVRHWRRGHCLPRVHVMERIVKMSKGRVSYNQMIEAHLSYQKSLTKKA